MSLAKFSEIIDRSAIGIAVSKRRELIEKTDPRRIYPENIRSFFHIPRSLAQFLCEIAVREGVFEKRVGYLCPNDDCHRMLIDTAQDFPPEEILHCESCEALERIRSSFSASECRQITFYRLVTKD
jgi:hypothetical protein